MPKTCYCCTRRSMPICLCRDGTCRRCLKCEQHCSCSLKPLGPEPEPAVVRLCTGGTAPAGLVAPDAEELSPRRNAA